MYASFVSSSMSQNQRRVVASYCGVNPSTVTSLLGSSSSGNCSPTCATLRKLAEVGKATAALLHSGSCCDALLFHSGSWPSKLIYGYSGEDGVGTAPPSTTPSNSP